MGFSFAYLLFRAPAIVLGDVTGLVAAARPHPGADRVAVRLAPSVVCPGHHTLVLYEAAAGGAAKLSISQSDLDDVGRRAGEDDMSLIDIFKEAVRLAGRSIAEHAPEPNEREPGPEPVLPSSSKPQLGVGGIDAGTHALAAWASARFGNALFVCGEPFSRIGGSASYLKGEQQSLRVGEEHYDLEPSRAVSAYTEVDALDGRAPFDELEADESRAPMMLIAEGGRYLDPARPLSEEEQRAFSVCL